MRKIDISKPELLTPDDILSESLLEAIYEEEDLVQRFFIIEKVERQADRYRIKEKFKKLIQAQEKQLREARKALAVKAVNTDEQSSNSMTMEFEPGEVIYAQTGKWIVSERGVKSISFAGPVVASHYPIIIAERMVSRDTHKEKVKLMWKKNNRVCSIMPYRSEISSNSKIVNLSDYGFPATSETARALVSYLSDYEALNYDLIPMKESTAKLGWIDGDFLPYSNSEIIFDAHPSYSHVFDSIKSEGSFNTWLSLLRIIRKSGRQEPLVYLAGSFASVLLHWLNVSPFMINLYGKTGGGKTVNLMLATSIWGDPSKGQYIIESTSTVNSMEQYLNLLNHLPLMIDDLSKIRDRDKDRFPELIYMLCAGRGKGRLTKDIGLRDTASWNNVILTNMERPLTDGNMKGGAVNRVLDFEIQQGNIFENGNAVVEIISQNYGHAGKLFVQAIQSIGAEKLKEKVHENMQKIKAFTRAQGEEKEEKQIIPLAVLLTADQISEEVIFKDGIHCDMKYCVAALKNEEEVSEMDRAYNHLIDAVQIYRNRFEPAESGEYRGEIWGCFPRGGKTVAIVPSAFEKIGEMYNFSPFQFAKWAKEENILEYESGKLQKKVTIPGTGKKVRCYVFKIEDDHEEEEFIDGKQEEIPFD